MSIRLVAALCAAALMIVAPSGGTPAHEGHDHGETPPPVASQSSPRGEASSDSFELVAILREGTLYLYLDSFETNAPIEGATIEVETPSGPRTATAQRGQPYSLDAPWLTAGQRHEILFTISAADTVDIFPLMLDVPLPQATVAPVSSFWGITRARAETASHFVAERGTLVVLGFGFLLGIAVTLLLRGTRKPQISSLALAVVLTLPLSAGAHEGHDHGDGAQALPLQLGEFAQRLPDGSVFVPKPVQRIFAVRTVKAVSTQHPRAIELPGRIIPDPDASGYVPTSVGGRLSPPPGGFPRLGRRVEKGEIVAYVTPPLQAIDASDMRQRQGELDQQILIVRQRVGRFEQLAPKGAVPRSQLDEARIELEGLVERRKALEQARGEPEALAAPVSGVIAEGIPVSGQMAQPNAVVYHIVDPKRLWVEALSFEALDAVPAASGLTSNGRELVLSYRGTGFADRNQSVPVHFSVEGESSGLRAGQFVTVTVVLPEKIEGIAVPKASVVRDANGQDLVYEHVTAERFQPRQVRTQPLDATRVLIAAGVEPGRRIVSQAAELLGHVR
jgi:membrane fusion protein, heavy metal efflux system